MFFETSDNTEKLDEAMAKMQIDLKPVKKSKENPFFKKPDGTKSKYADIEDVIEASRDALAKHGISITQWPIHSADNRLTLVTRVAHGGQWMKAIFSVPVTKLDAQGYGAATTYIRRFALMAVLGVAGEDDDGNTAAGKTIEPKQAQPQQMPLQNFAPRPTPTTSKNEKSF